MSVLLSLAFLIFLRPIHSKKFIFFLAVMNHQINGIRVKSTIWITLLINDWIKRFIINSPSLLSLYESNYRNRIFRSNYSNINLSLISHNMINLTGIFNLNSTIKKSDIIRKASCCKMGIRTDLSGYFQSFSNQ